MKSVAPTSTHNATGWRMTFKEALKLLERGNRVKRAGWPKGEYVEWQSASTPRFVADFPADYYRFSPSGVSLRCIFVAEEHAATDWMTA